MVYNFATGTLRTLIPLLPGEPRHLVIDRTGRYLYASLNKGGGVVKIDIRQRRVVDRVRTGVNPRTIVLAPDGRSLYVVNYESQTVAKVRTRDMVVLQRLGDPGRAPGRHRLRREDPHGVGRLLPGHDRALRRPVAQPPAQRQGSGRQALPRSRPSPASRPPSATNPTRDLHRLAPGDQRRRQVGEHAARSSDGALRRRVGAAGQVRDRLQRLLVDARAGSRPARRSRRRHRRRHRSSRRRGSLPRNCRRQRGLELRRPPRSRTRWCRRAARGPPPAAPPRAARRRRCSPRR